MLDPPPSVTSICPDLSRLSLSRHDQVETGVKQSNEEKERIKQEKERIKQEKQIAKEIKKAQDKRDREIANRAAKERAEREKELLDARIAASRQKYAFYVKIASGHVPQHELTAETAFLAPPPGRMWPGGWPNISTQEYGLRHGQSGVTVIKVLDPASRLRLYNELGADCNAFSEYEPGMDFFDDNEKWVGGGFSGLGNPSSFHCLTVRKLRRIVMLAVLKSGVIPMTSTVNSPVLFEQLVCRMIIRPAGDAPPKESFHRDEAVGTQTGDTVYGGGINMSDSDQFMSFVPYTATLVQDRNFGFALIPPEHGAMWKLQSKLVRIPSGCLLIFNERTIHEVRSNTHNEKMVRLHFGWRTTTSRTPLINTLDHCIDTQEAFPLKSGQHEHPNPPPGAEIQPEKGYVPGPPPMWPPLYRVNFPEKLIELAKKLKPACRTVEHYSTKSKVQYARWETPRGPTGETGVLATYQYMPSLAALRGLDPSITMYPAYEPIEKEILRPNINWTGLLDPNGYEHSFSLYLTATDADTDMEEAEEEAGSSFAPPAAEANPRGLTIKDLFGESESSSDDEEENKPLGGRAAARKRAARKRPAAATVVQTPPPIVTEFPPDWKTISLEEGKEFVGYVEEVDDDDW